MTSRKKKLLICCRCIIYLCLEIMMQFGPQMLVCLIRYPENSISLYTTNYNRVRFAAFDGGLGV